MRGKGREKGNLRGKRGKGEECGWMEENGQAEMDKTLIEIKNKNQ